MEKRIFLAFMLSFLILITWNRLFPPQRSTPQQITQTIENKEVSDGFQAETKQDVPLPLSEGQQRREEKIVTINNGKLELQLTTRGGGIASARILDYDAVLPVRDVFQMTAFSELDYSIETQEERKIVFVARQRDLVIRKSFIVPDEDFIVQADIQIQNTGREVYAIEPAIKTMLLDMSLLGKEIENGRDRNLLEYSVFSDGKVVRKTGAFKFTQKENKTILAPVEWFGFRDRYFSAIVKPDFPVKGYEFLADNSDGKRLSMNAVSDKQSLGAEETLSFPATIYIGPQNSRILKQYDLSFEKIQVYFGLAFMDAIAKIIEDLMIVMHKVIPNWGASIILVSLLIYFAMYPLTMKSMVSMRKMQGLQPKIVELRAKYDKNPQKLNQEIMKLYAENKVNPIGGCLPLLLQMPIFICLYQMIWRSILFKGSSFLWIKDLSEPDRLFILGQSFPVIGNEINLLPALILVLMVVQQKMTAKNMVITDPNQLMQQKMMTFMMPVVLLLVFYRIASGLTLYLTVFYVMSSFTQWRVAKITKAAM